MNKGMIGEITTKKWHNWRQMFENQYQSLSKQS